MTTTDKNHAFKDFLKAEMKARDWRQSDLVRATNIPASTISRWLDEKDPGPPDMENLMLLSFALNVGMETLLTYPYRGQFYGSHISADGRLLAERFDKLPEVIRNSILALMREHLK